MIRPAFSCRAAGTRTAPYIAPSPPAPAHPRSGGKRRKSASLAWETGCDDAVPRYLGRVLDQPKLVRCLFRAAYSARNGTAARPVRAGCRTPIKPVGASRILALPERRGGPQASICAGNSSSSPSGPSPRLVVGSPIWTCMPQISIAPDSPRPCSCASRCNVPCQCVCCPSSRRTDGTRRDGRRCAARRRRDGAAQGAADRRALPDVAADAVADLDLAFQELGDTCPSSSAAQPSIRPSGSSAQVAVPVDHQIFLLDCRA